MWFNYRRWFKKRKSQVLDLDEIFLDSGNLPSFDTNQFEGRIEKPITKNILTGVFVSFIIVSLFLRFAWVLFKLCRVKVLP